MKWKLLNKHVSYTHDTLVFHILKLSMPFGREMCVNNIFRCNPFVIVNIFISICNLITQFFSVTMTDYSYIYFVVQFRYM